MRGLMVVVLAACTCACSGAVPDDEDVNASEDALAGAALETWDGTTAHVYGGRCETVRATSGTNVHYGGSGTVTDTCGYQCVELAVRYFYFRKGIAKSSWFVPTAIDMCNSHPAGVVKTSSPHAGDLMVFKPNDSGTGTGSAGHVAVIRGVNSDGSLNLFQQRWGNESTAFYHGMPRYHAACFLHSQNGGSSSGGGGACGCYAGNGAYCGKMMIDYKQAHGCSITGTHLSPGADPTHDIDPRFLYSCENGVWTIKQECNLSNESCIYNPNGADYCH